MNTEAAERYYPNIMGRIILQAMEEILGNGGIDKVLDQSRLPQLIDNFPPGDLNREVPFSHISRIMSSLEDIYGERAGQGLAVRSGRVCFKVGLREFGRLNFPSDPNFRMLPLNTKIRQGARLFTDLFNEYTDQRAWFGEDDKYFYWHTENCPLCWQRHAEKPVCQLAVGILQEALYWVSGGKLYQVEEAACLARGDRTCTFRIDRAPYE